MFSNVSVFDFVSKIDLMVQRPRKCLECVPLKMSSSEAVLWKQTLFKWALKANLMFLSLHLNNTMWFLSNLSGKSDSLNKNSFIKMLIYGSIIYFYLSFIYCKIACLEGLPFCYVRFH